MKFDEVDTKCLKDSEDWFKSLEKMNRASDEYKLVIEKFKNAITSEAVALANVNLYSGFLKIIAENPAAKNEKQSNEFKNKLQEAVNQLGNIINALNECKSGLVLTQESLPKNASPLKEDINRHLNTINSAVNLSHPYLTGFVTNKEVAQNTEMVDTKANNNGIPDEHKVVAEEPVEKPKDDATLEAISTDSLNSIDKTLGDELDDIFGKDVLKNNDNIATLNDTVSSYNKNKPFAIKNPYGAQNFATVGFDDDNSEEMAGSLAGSNPQSSNTNKTSIDDDYLGSLFAQPVENDASKSLDTSAKDVVDSANTSVDVVPQKVTAMEDFDKINKETGDLNSNGYGRNLTKPE